MSFKLYPVGRQDFPSIIEDGFVYVDKTMYAYELAKLGGSYFLSKPRRFGKSLFISTLETIFLGKKEYFKGMYIYDKWKFEEYPIIRISFSNIGHKTMGLSLSISSELSFIAKKNQIELTFEKENIGNLFKELISKLFQKYNQKVVILIDEYDKPIIDYLNKDNIHQAKENREILKNFYSILKDAEPYVKLLFITGVTKFSKVSIFSDLNNLTDLSTHLQFNEICGISQKELEAYFPEELKVYDKEKIKVWYNGYKWDIDGNTVYNPFSLLNFFYGKGKFQNFWFTSGTPTFLMELSKKEHFYRFETVEIGDIDMQTFELENINLIPLLFQTGYLTILSKNELLNNYILGFPNREVREAYLQKLADTYIQSQLTSSKVILSDLLKSFQNKDKELMQKSINNAFAHIPYDLWQKENEQYYHAIVHLLFSLLNVYIFSEVHTQTGRADAVVIHENGIYCFEFKLDQTAEKAIEQIKTKNYTERFKDSEKTIHHIGINFSSKNKSVEAIIWETL